MTAHPIRFFADDATVRQLGERLLAASLPRAEWTHEAHLAACLWLLAERADIDAAAALPDIIRRHNESVGTVNDDQGGFHASITSAYLVGVAAFLTRCDAAMPLAAKVNALLAAPEGQRDWPLHFYSRALLFSVAARRAVVAPDLRPLPDAPRGKAS